ncbi:hypothetical protein DEJ21_16425 [Curtobacterium sp. MCSS17_006]|nr:hypothetical protein DEJ21_16425 [Curtobacterium sp. MCSS17_006]
MAPTRGTRSVSCADSRQPTADSRQPTADSRQPTAPVGSGSAARGQPSCVPRNVTTRRLIASSS